MTDHADITGNVRESTISKQESAYIDCQDGVREIEGTRNCLNRERRLVPPPEAQRLIKHYRPKKNIRKPDKMLAKEIISLWQGFDGTIALCELCEDEQPQPIDKMTIEHPCGEKHNNSIFVLKVAHHECNSSDDKRRRGRQNNNEFVNATLLKREKRTDSELLQKSKQVQDLEEAPPTFRSGKKYRIRALEHLIEKVTDDEEFDVIVTDIEALTGCSHYKAIEYANSYCLSIYAPFVKTIDKKGIAWVRPRIGWDASEYATMEYKIALRNLQEKKMQNLTMELGSGAGAVVSSHAEVQK